MAEKDWETLEKVVAILEQHLDHNAVVRQNVALPVIGNDSGRTCKCDVVIVQGDEPRQTISIVEVQKRAGKPKINDFRGWLLKMQELGAQHLLRVSEAGFPSSIEDLAMKQGPSVRLLTISKLESGTLPLPQTPSRNSSSWSATSNLSGGYAKLS